MAKLLHEREKTYTLGNKDKNANLMLDVLGFPIRRQMITRLRDGGAMSLTKLVEPFGITLPTALTHLRALELSGLVVTNKQGRVRMCAHNKQALKELAVWLNG
jgi:DNA-binding transcriptional ArsR family regulator